MRIASDALALQSSKLPPNAKTAIAAIAGVRPVLLARATYQTVAATKAGTFLTYTFPAGALRPGDQLALKLYGVVTNPSAFVDTFFAEVDVIQDSAFQILSAVFATINNTTTNPVSWCLDAALAFSVPKTNEQTFLASVSSASTARAERLPNAALMVGGYMAMTVTNAADFAAATTGGQPVSTATTGSYQISTLNANNQTFSNERPTAISVKITNGSFNSFAVMGGWLMGL